MNERNLSRILAAFFDFAIILPIFTEISSRDTLIILSFYSMIDSNSFFAQLIPLDITNGAIAFMFYFAYFLIPLLFFKKTFGQFIFKVKTINKSALKPSFIRLVLWCAITLLKTAIFTYFLFFLKMMSVPTIVIILLMIAIPYWHFKRELFLQDKIAGIRILVDEESFLNDTLRLIIAALVMVPSFFYFSNFVYKQSQLDWRLGKIENRSIFIVSVV